MSNNNTPAISKEFMMQWPYTKTISLYKSMRDPYYVWIRYRDPEDLDNKDHDRYVLLTDYMIEFILVMKISKNEYHGCVFANQQIIVVSYSKNLIECIQQAEKFAQQFLVIEHMRNSSSFALKHDMEHASPKQYKVIIDQKLSEGLMYDSLHAFRVIKATVFEKKLNSTYNDILFKWGSKYKYIPVFDMLQE